MIQWPKGQAGLIAVLGTVFGSFFLLVLLAVIFGLIFYCIYRRSKTSRAGYTSLRNDVERGRENNRSQNKLVGLQQLEGTSGDEGLFEAMQRQENEQEQQRRDVALLTCQFYLRSISMFVLDRQLPDIGSRMSKNWFVVRKIRTTAQTLLTMLPVSQQCRLNLQEDRDTLRRLVKALDHMNIHQIHDIDYIADRRMVVILEPLHTRGSLKDLIYQTTPNLGWSTKYSVRRSGLKLKQVQSFGRQVLHGILFLHHVGFKPLGQIQSGNVYLEGGTVKLAGYENQLLGYKPRMYRLVKGYKSQIDSAMFGHLLFELSCGRELASVLPSDSDMSSVKHEQVQNVLRFIFYNESREMPSIEDILNHPFFRDQNAPGLDHWSYEGVKLDEGIKDVIVKSKTGKLSKGSGNVSLGKKKQKSVAPRYPVFKRSTKPSTLAPIAQSPNTPSSILVQEKHAKSSPPKKNKSSVSERDPPPPSKDRSALLGDIRSGAKLRKTVTNDRSAPLLQ